MRGIPSWDETTERDTREEKETIFTTETARMDRRDRTKTELDFLLEEDEAPGGGNRTH